MIPIDPDGESTTTWMLRAERLKDELAKCRNRLKGMPEMASCERCGSPYLVHRLYPQCPCWVHSERDSLLAVLREIAHNNDCDPRAEAREVLEGKPINPLACPRCGTPVDDRGGQCACEEGKP